MGRLGQENSLKPPQESYKAFLKNTTNLKTLNQQSVNAFYKFVIASNEKHIKKTTICVLLRICNYYTCLKLYLANELASSSI